MSQPQTDKPQRAALQDGLLKEVVRTEKAMLILCIGIAFLFWLLVKLNKTYTTTINLKTAYNLPFHKSLANVLPSDIDVEVKAKGFALLSRYLNNRKPTIALNINGNTKLISAQVLRKAIQGELSADIELLRLMPENIPVALENQGFKKVKIKVLLKNIEGRQLGLASPVQIVPDSVELVGSVSELNKIKEWVTDTLRLLPIVGEQTGGLLLSRSIYPHLKVQPGSVQYKTLTEQMTEKNIELRVKIRNAKDSIQLFPRQVNVVCAVGLSHFDEVDADDFEVVIDLNGVDLKRTNSLPLKVVKRPENVKLIAVQPDRVEFMIIKK